MHQQFDIRIQSTIAFKLINWGGNMEFPFYWNIISFYYEIDHDTHESTIT